MTSNGIILFNPRSAWSKHRIPNSILQLGASLEGKYSYVFVDGNREREPIQTILNYLESGKFGYFGCSVMPGLQLKQAIPVSKQIRKLFPRVKTIWGGYFASNHFHAVLNSGYVDYVIYGPGDFTLPTLLDTLEQTSRANNLSVLPFISIPNLAFKMNLEIIKTSAAPLPDPERLAPLPYERLNQFYAMEGYLGKSWLGGKTAGYHSSMGCPFCCAFCGVTPIYNGRWRGKSAEGI
jgi:anaerobic magnesium-protoporphyrin IX monomethyl ester cyclase